MESGMCVIQLSVADRKAVRRLCYGALVTTFSNSEFGVGLKLPKKVMGGRPTLPALSESETGPPEESCSVQPLLDGGQRPSPIERDP